MHLAKTPLLLPGQARHDAPEVTAPTPIVIPDLIRDPPPLERQQSANLCESERMVAPASALDQEEIDA